MKLLRRLLGAITLVLSTVVFAASVAGIAGIWMFHQKVTEKVENLAPRLDAGLERAFDATENVRATLKMVREDVAPAKIDPGEADDLAARAARNQFVAGYFRTVIQRLKKFADADSTVSALLRSFQDLPLGDAGRITPEKLDRAAVKAAQLSATVQRLQDTFSYDDMFVFNESDLVAAANDLDGAVQGYEETVDDWQSDLAAARAELPHLKTRILGA